MTTPGIPELLERDHGLDASSADYPSAVRSVLLAPWVTAGADHGSGATTAGEAIQLSARTVSALNEVARWANDGQSADPTACAWLAYLRWAVANGAQLPADAPLPPADLLDRDYPVLSGPGDHHGDSFTALSTGQLGEVLRPVLPGAQSPEVLARTAPYGLIPNVGWKSLIVLALDSAAITHGSAEAQTAATAMALTVHAAVRARSSNASLADVVAATARVSAEITRPAPRTMGMLTLCADGAARAGLWTNAADGLTGALGTGSTASEALALGLAALLTAEGGGTAPGDHAEENPATVRAETRSGDDVARAARALLTGSGVTSRAAHDVATVVAAARWGLADARTDWLDADPRSDSTAEPEHDDLATAGPVSTPNAPGTPRDHPDQVRTELLRLAEEWNALWRP